MGKLIFISIFALGIVFSVAGIADFGDTVEQRGLALMATGMTESNLKTFVRDYYEESILSDEQELGDAKIILTYVDINTDSAKDIIAVVESDATCGNSGCITTIFLTDEMREPVAIPGFRYASKEIRVLETITNGMHDLEINKNKKSRLTWDGTRYQLE